MMRRTQPRLKKARVESITSASALYAVLLQHVATFLTTKDVIQASFTQSAWRNAMILHAPPRKSSVCFQSTDLLILCIRTTFARHVTTVDLSRNRIGYVGAAAVAAVIKNNTTITSIDLSRNRIRDAGSAAVASAIAGNSSDIYRSACQSYDSYRSNLLSPCDQGE